MNHDRLVEYFACEVCGKPQELSPDDCHSTIGRNNPLCNEHDCCRIKEKSEEQLKYALSPIHQNIFLKACPGSGKTEVVGLKSAYEIQKWDRKVGGIAILTFTNNAADVIKDRVSQFVGKERTAYPHYIGTFDSWLHGYIAQPFAYLKVEHKKEKDDFSFQLVNEDDDSGWLNAHKLDTPYFYFKKNSNVPTPTSLYANMVRYNYETEVWEIRSPNSKRNEYLPDADYFDSPAFSKFRSDKPWLTLAYIQERFKSKKDQFHKKGFATYADIENICFELLREKSELIQRLGKRFPLIIVDECQDLSWIQLQILEKIKDAGSALHFVGDLNQAIFEFRKVDPSKVVSFVEDHKFEKLSLKDNFRSCQAVVDICRQIVNDESEIIGKCKQDLKQPCIYVTYTKATMSTLPKWFEDFLKQNSLNIKQSAIVARNWNNVSLLRPSSNSDISNYQKRLAMAIYLWKTGNVQAISDTLKYMGHFFAEKYFDKYSSNARQYYCPECVSSSIQWRLFLAEMLKRCIQNEKLSNLEETWSDWACSVRNHFGEVARICQPTIENSLTGALPSFSDLDSFSALPRAGSKPVIESLSVHQSQNTNIRITTIHGVKGEDLEGIMVVSAPSTQGTKDGHWTQWLEDPTSEAARLGYVASSRPKHLLVWAIPKEERDTDYGRLEKLSRVL